MSHGPRAAQARPDCLVVGGGWAGLTAAVDLTLAGRRVTLIDAAPQWGGRARTLSLSYEGSTVRVDNGQHLLVGAYTTLFALLDRIGIDPRDRLQRRALSLHSVDGLHLDASKAPGRAGLALGLLGARGLSLGERWAAVRLLGRLPSDATRHWPGGLTVLPWLRSRGQPARLIERLWAPVCVGTMNTDPQVACARTFARVLRDIFRGAADASDLLLPRGALGSVLPDPAGDWLSRQGAELRLRCTARALRRTEAGSWRVQTDAHEITAQQLVLALPPRQAAALLRPVLPPGLLPCPTRYDADPIGTVWLGWQAPIGLPEMVLLHDDPTAAQPGQWFFHRPDAAIPALPTVASVVISAAGRSLPAPAELAAQAARQVADQLGVAMPVFARAVIERHATWRCTPQRPVLDRDALARHQPGLALAGDWVWDEYPSTLESAVRSGAAAARQLLDQAR